MLNLVAHIVTTRPQNVSHRTVRCYIFRCTVVKEYTVHRKIESYDVRVSEIGKAAYLYMDESYIRVSIVTTHIC